MNQRKSSLLSNRSIKDIAWFVLVTGIGRRVKMQNDNAKFKPQFQSASWRTNVTQNPKSQNQSGWDLNNTWDFIGN